MNKIVLLSLGILTAISTSLTRINYSISENTIENIDCEFKKSVKNNIKYFIEYDDVFINYEEYINDMNKYFSSVNFKVNFSYSFRNESNIVYPVYVKEVLLKTIIHIGISNVNRTFNCKITKGESNEK